MTGDTRSTIKELIDDDDTPVDDVLSKAGARHGEAEAASTFDRMKREGEVYVVPRDDAPDVVKIT